MSRVNGTRESWQPFDPRPFPTSDQIAARAHELFVSGGRRLQQIPECWRAAEQELLDRAARRLLAPRSGQKR